MLTVVVPSRGRPAAIRELESELFRNSGDRGTHLVVGVDDDDPVGAEYSVSHPRATVVVGPRLRMGPTLNKLAAQLAREEPASVIGFMGDDHRPRTLGWDRHVIEAMNALGRPGVVYGNDLVHGEGLPTAVFVHAHLINQLGYIAPPGLIHLYLDNFWLDLGRATAVSYIPHVVIEHMHPLVGKAEWDAGYLEANAGEVQSHDHDEYHRYIEHDWPTERLKLEA